MRGLVPLRAALERAAAAHARLHGRRAGLRRPRGAGGALLRGPRRAPRGRARGARPGGRARRGAALLLAGPGAGLKDSVGERPNHSNFRYQNFGQILPEFKKCF